jgi:hypothetical protein
MFPIARNDCPERRRQMRLFHWDDCARGELLSVSSGKDRKNVSAGIVEPIGAAFMGLRGPAAPCSTAPDATAQRLLSEDSDRTTCASIVSANRASAHKVLTGARHRVKVLATASTRSPAKGRRRSRAASMPRHLFEASPECELQIGFDSACAGFVNVLVSLLGWQGDPRRPNRQLPDAPHALR